MLAIPFQKSSSQLYNLVLFLIHNVNEEWNMADT